MLGEYFESNPIDFSGSSRSPISSEVQTLFDKLCEHENEETVDSCRNNRSVLELLQAYQILMGVLKKNEQKPGIYALTLAANDTQVKNMPFLDAIELNISPNFQGAGQAAVVKEIGEILGCIDGPASDSAIGLKFLEGVRTALGQNNIEILKNQLRILPIPTILYGSEDSSYLALWPHIRESFENIHQFLHEDPSRTVMFWSSPQNPNKRLLLGGGVQGELPLDIRAYVEAYAELLQDPDFVGLDPGSEKARTKVFLYSRANFLSFEIARLHSGSRLGELNKELEEINRQKTDASIKNPYLSNDMWHVLKAAEEQRLKLLSEVKKKDLEINQKFAVSDENKEEIKKRWGEYGAAVQMHYPKEDSAGASGSAQPALSYRTFSKFIFDRLCECFKHSHKVSNTNIQKIDFNDCFNSKKTKDLNDFVGEAKFRLGGEFVQKVFKLIYLSKLMESIWQGKMLSEKAVNDYLSLPCVAEHSNLVSGFTLFGKPKKTATAAVIVGIIDVLNKNTPQSCLRKIHFSRFNPKDEVKDALAQAKYILTCARRDVELYGYDAIGITHAVTQDQAMQFWKDYGWENGRLRWANIPENFNDSDQAEVVMAIRDLLKNEFGDLQGKFYILPISTLPVSKRSDNIPKCLDYICKFVNNPSQKTLAYGWVGAGGEYSLGGFVEPALSKEHIKMLNKSLNALQVRNPNPLTDVMDKFCDKCSKICEQLKDNKEYKEYQKSQQEQPTNIHLRKTLSDDVNMLLEKRQALFWCITKYYSFDGITAADIPEIQKKFRAASKERGMQNLCNELVTTLENHAAEPVASTSTSSNNFFRM